MKFLQFFQGNKTKKIALTATLTALSICLALASFPVFPTAPFLRMDFADTSLFIVGMICGPIYGLIATFISCLIQDLTIAPTPAHSGLLIHFLITGLTMLTISLIYRLYIRKNILVKIENNEFLEKKQNLIDSINYIAISFFCGAIVWFSLAILLNLTIIPAIYNMSAKQVINSLLGILIAFNAIKYVINFFFALLVIIRAHKSLSKNYKKENKN